MTTKTLLFLALVCISTAQRGGSQRCLCGNFRDDVSLRPKSIKNMEVIPPSNSCDNMEIILNLTNGTRICLNPNAKNFITVLKKLRAKRGISQAQ